MTASAPIHDSDLLEVFATIASIRETGLALLDHHDTLPTRASVSPSSDGDSPPPAAAAPEQQRQQAELLAHVAALRGLHRRAVLSVRGTRQVVADARGEVDRLSLQLQNLAYEQRHLRGEIAACEGYEWVALCLSWTVIWTEC
jgi:THO complex subunit 5